MKKNAFSLACAGFLCSCGAHAQQTRPAQAEKPIATVEVKAGADLLRRSDTASRIVVTHDELAKYGDQDVLDALKRVPGVTVSGTDVRLRGMGSGYTQLLVNGNRPPAGFSLDALNPDLVERVEVMRAATAEFSTQAIAGTINIVLKNSVSKRSGDVKLNAGGQPGVRTSGLVVQRSDKREGFSWVLGGGINRVGNARDSTETVEGRDPAGLPLELNTTSSRRDFRFAGGQLNARLNWALEGGSTLSWQTFLDRGHTGGDAHEHTWVDYGLAYPYPDLASPFRADTANLRSELAYVLKLPAGGKLDTRASASVSRVDRAIELLGRDDMAQPVLDRRTANNIRERLGSLARLYRQPQPAA